MEKAVEFSFLYKIINAIRQGDDSKKIELEKILEEYTNGEKADSFLHEIGQKFITIGIEEFLNQAEATDIKVAKKLTNKKWMEIAYKMINYARNNKLSKELGSKWNIPKREIEKHFTPMARYVTEGLIDSLDDDDK